MMSETPSISKTIYHGLAAFSRHIRTRLQELTFPEQQKARAPGRDEVTVRDHHVAIYFKIPIEISPRHPLPPLPPPASGKAVSTQFALRSPHGEASSVTERIFLWNTGQRAADCEKDQPGS